MAQALTNTLLSSIVTYGCVGCQLENVFFFSTHSVTKFPTCGLCVQHNNPTTVSSTSHDYGVDLFSYSYPDVAVCLVSL
jgi:hypothetical protein